MLGSIRKQRRREKLRQNSLILQYAKLRMSELFYNVFIKFCDKFEVCELNRNSLFGFGRRKFRGMFFSPASEQNRSEARTVETIWEQMLKTTPLHTCCSKHQKHDKMEPRLFKEEFICDKCCACVLNSFAVTIVKVKNISLAVKEWLNMH